MFKFKRVGYRLSLFYTTKHQYEWPMIFDVDRLNVLSSLLTYQITAAFATATFLHLEQVICTNYRAGYVLFGKVT